MKSGFGQAGRSAVRTVYSRTCAYSTAFFAPLSVGVEEKAG